LRLVRGSLQSRDAPTAAVVAPLSNPRKFSATMKHGKTFRKLGRDSAHRWAMMRTMVTQLIEHERIKTTVAKAKELRKVADRVVTYAKRGTLSARRRATAVVRTDAAVQKLFTELAARYQGRAGGFTRVLQTGQRKSDSAQMAFIEYVDREGELRPARPAAGLGLSWAAKEYVQRQLAEERSARGRSKGEARGAAEPADDGIPPL
jgi:large subunit ribosomal protein L17